jgi:WhiB family redox-sensing transcriptional regulator
MVTVFAPGKLASCDGIETDYFYPTNHTSKDPGAAKDNLEPLPQEYLKRLCENCLVLDECREWAIKHEAYGYWGGMTPSQRKAFRQKHKIRYEEVWGDHDWKRIKRIMNGTQKEHEARLARESSK